MKRHVATVARVIELTVCITLYDACARLLRFPRLRLFTQDGAQVWEKRTPGAVWGVNVSGDGRWVVAALGDGSVRWYRASDGQEQLALFVHGDHERWIAWTPTGYYDTSMGGENLVGCMSIVHLINRPIFSL